mgnify:CR=1 FL=1
MKFILLVSCWSLVNAVFITAPEGGHPADLFLIIDAAQQTPRIRTSRQQVFDAATSASTKAAPPPYNTYEYMSYVERSTLFLTNAVRLSYKGYVSVFLKGVNTIGSSCAASAPSAKPLYWQVNLQNAARAHTTDMSSRNCFTHDTCSPALCKMYGSCSFASRIAYFYKKPLYCAENCIVGFSTVGYANLIKALSAYLNSAGHCSNIMKPGLSEIGVAWNGTWNTNNFGGGPSDYAGFPITVGTHVVNDNNSVTFYMNYYSASAAVSPVVCLNKDNCQGMLSVNMYPGTIFQWTLAANNTLPVCITYVFYVFNANAYKRFPYKGAFYTNSYKGCAKEYTTEFI